jgi:hypothetical protein
MWMQSRASAEATIAILCAPCAHLLGRLLFPYDEWTETLRSEL